MGSKVGQLGSPKNPGMTSSLPFGGYGNAKSEDTVEAEHLKLKFMELDQGGDGMLDLDELVLLLHQGQLNMSEQEIIRFFKILDKDKIGKVSFNDVVEFIFKT